MRCDDSRPILGIVLVAVSFLVYGLGTIYLIIWSCMTPYVENLPTNYRTITAFVFIIFVYIGITLPSLLLFLRWIDYNLL